MRCEFAAKPGQIESSIDLPHQMIFRNRVVELKLVQKLRLSALQPTHHGLPPPRFASARWNHCSPHASTDFCNKISQKRTFVARAPIRLRAHSQRKLVEQDLGLLQVRRVETFCEPPINRR